MKTERDANLLRYGCILFKKKWDFNSKDSKWIFKIDFNEKRFEKVFYFKIKEINLKKQQNERNKNTKQNERKQIHKIKFFDNRAN